jgi:hypothetical protein
VWFRGLFVPSFLSPLVCLSHNHATGAWTNVTTLASSPSHHEPLGTIVRQLRRSANIVPCEKWGVRNYSTAVLTRLLGR